MKIVDITEKRMIFKFYSVYVCMTVNFSKWYAKLAGPF